MQLVQLPGLLASLWNMRVIRIIFAGLMALAVLVAGILMAGVVMLAGLGSFAAQFLGGKKRMVRPTTQPEKTDRVPVGPTDDVIDVEATRVP